ncbi:MAG TPA: hypothetical protein VMV18_05500 [bacterium]|nr:hypothetical protein [bacterium]
MSTPGNAPQAPAAPPKKSNKMLIGCLIGCGFLLCVVVPIVGILAAVAVPNFQKYKCKSMQSEAKMNLKGLQIAEESFHADHGYYTSDLAALKWQPDGSPRYLYGFADAGPGDVRRAEAPSDYDETRKDTFALSGVNTEKMVDRNGTRLAAADFPDSYVERDKFVAAAVGDIVSTSDGHLDSWTVDEKGAVQNDFDACSGRPGFGGDENATGTDDRD